MGDRHKGTDDRNIDKHQMVMDSLIPCAHALCFLYTRLSPPQPRAFLCHTAVLWSSISAHQRGTRNRTTPKCPRCAPRPLTNALSTTTENLVFRSKGGHSCRPRKATVLVLLTASLQPEPGSPSHPPCPHLEDGIALTLPVLSELKRANLCYRC